MATDYKVGDWLEDRHNGDLYEILEVWYTNSDFYCKIGKKFDKSTKSKYLAIFNRTIFSEELAFRFKLSLAAQVLLKG